MNSLVGVLLGRVSLRCFFGESSSLGSLGRDEP